MIRIEKERIARAARIFRRNVDAANALNVHPSAFCKMCRRYAIMTPSQRRAKMN